MVKVVKLESIATSIDYGLGLSADWKPTPYRYLRTTDMTSGRIYWDRVPFCSPGKNDVLKGSLEDLDIVISRTGANAGAPGIVLSPPTNTLFAGYLVRFKIDKKLANPKYVYLILTSQLWSDYSKYSRTGSGQPQLNAKLMGRFEFPLPSLPVQNSIVDMLWPIHEQISNCHEALKLNRKFLVDLYSYFFEQKAMSQQSSFVDNDDLGFEIPSTWRVEPLGKSKVLSIVKTGVKDFRGNKKYFATADIDGNDFETTATSIDYSGRESRANMQPITSSVWIAKMKDTDKTFFLNDEHEKLIDSSIFSTGFFGFHTSKEFLPYLYGFLNSNYFVTKKNFFATGATQEAINQWMLDYIYIPIPDSGLIDKFNEVVIPIMNQIAVSQISIFSYTEAVDTLLPQILNN